MKLAENDYIVLGFLLMRPMTGYEMKAMMDSTAGNFYRPSYGGIYPSLKRLTQAGLAASTQSVEGGKLRKKYRPLAPGKITFREWLQRPPEITKGPGAILLKMFFLGQADRDTVQVFRREVLRMARERSEWLQRTEVEIRGRADAYQTATCRFGIEYYAFLQDWFTRWEVGE